MSKISELTSPRSQLPCTVTRASPSIKVSLLQLTHLIYFMVQVRGAGGKFQSLPSQTQTRDLKFSTEPSCPNMEKKPSFATGLKLNIK